jgi:ankyrin repeat protein
MPVSIEDMVDACRKGQTQFVEDWIGAGRSVNKPGSGKTTALMAASEHGHVEIAKTLIDAGADVCFGGSGGWTALMLAARGGHLEVVQLLINAGADLTSKSILGDTALSLALANRKIRVAQFLQNAGAVVNAKALHDVAHQYVEERARATRDYTPHLRQAAANKAKVLRPLVEKVIAAGAEGGDYALWEAVKYRQRDTVQMLLAAKADPNAAPHATSALAKACDNRDLKSVQLLLDAGADPNFGRGPDAPLIIAIEKNSRSIVAELIRRGANLNAQRMHGPTPLLLAASQNKLPLMRDLLKAGADPNLAGTVEIGTAPKPTVTIESAESELITVKTTRVPSAPEACNVTPLIVAARRNFCDAARLLLKHGADPELKDSEGMTAMGWAKKLRHTWIGVALVQHGAKATASSEGSLENALVSAARKGNLARVRELLAQGANPNGHIEGADYRRTPLGEAAKNGSPEILKALLDAGAEVDKPTLEFPARSITPLMLAAKAGHPEAVSALLKAGANVGARDTELVGGGATPLHYGARTGNPEVLKLLIAAGADVSARDTDKTTPVQSAAAHGHADALDVLLQHTTVRAVKGVSQALFLATVGGHVKAVKRILAANPNAHGNDPEFATMVACSARLEIIEALLKTGMRFDQQNRDGWTPLRMARRAKRENVVALLRAHHAT